MKDRKKQNRFLAIFAAAAVLLSTSACSWLDESYNLLEDSYSLINDAYAYSDTYGSDGNGWTIMLYLCGTDLETDGGYGSINLEEICNAELPEDVCFLIETGGTDQWWWDDIDSGVLGRYQAQNGELVPIETQPQASMGEASTLVDFVNWGVSNYPNEHYGLILWDHGGGSVDGICYDQCYDNDNLNMIELGQAMAQLPVTLDLIGFDACLMASLECAKMLQPAGHYMVASEETEPGYGWDYTAMLNALAEDTSMTGDELGRVICDTFYSKCEQNDLADTATLSVIDLAQISQINDCFNQFASSMALSTQDMEAFRDVAGGVDNAESFGGNTPEEGYCNLVDLVDMVDNTCDAVVGEDNGSGLVEAIKSAVLYEVHGAARSNANGLAVYYPLEIDAETIEYYYSFSDNTPYLQYLSALSGDYAAQGWSTQTSSDEYEESAYYEESSYEDDSSEDDFSDLWEFFFGDDSSEDYDSSYEDDYDYEDDAA